MPPWQDKVLRIADLKPHRLHVLVGGQGNIEALSWLKAFGLRLSHPGQLEGHTESVLQAIWRRDQGAICSELSGLGQWIKCALRGWAPWRVLLKAPWDQAIGANFTRTLELDWAAHKNRNPPHSPCRKRKRILFFIWVVESDLATAKGLAIKGVGAPIRLNGQRARLGHLCHLFRRGWQRGHLCCCCRSGVLNSGDIGCRRCHWGRWRWCSRRGGGRQLRWGRIDPGDLKRPFGRLLGQLEPGRWPLPNEDQQQHMQEHHEGEAARKKTGGCHGFDLTLL